MSDRSNLVYRYDGTFPGLMCCVAECFRDKRLPLNIQLSDESQATLFPIKEVETDLNLARRVERSIPPKMGQQAYVLIRDAFLTCAENKEMMIVRFLLLGYKYGPRVTKLSTLEDVHAIDQAVKYLRNESHYHLEFLRFSDCGEFLAAAITPNNLVLPVIAPHFCNRFPTENFVIYDKTHSLGFLHQSSGKTEFFSADSLELPQPTEEEQACRELWKRFYQTIAIEGRRNPRLQQNLMPKRYWKNMTEFSGN